MHTNEIDHLLNILNNNKLNFSKKDKDNIWNNIVYYIPRIRTCEQLNRAINVLFQLNNPTLVEDPFELQEVVQSIFQWKLSISEPSVSISSFYKTWNSVIMAPRQKWTVTKLAILSGVLLTENVYEGLQKDYYIDDNRKTRDLYKQWRNNCFVPIFKHMLTDMSRNTPRSDNINILVSLYSTVAYSFDASQIKALPCNLIAESSINTIIKYITQTSKYPEFLNKRINCIALSLQKVIPYTDSVIVQQIVVRLNHHCEVLAEKEKNSDMPNRSYSGSFYSNILLTVVLIFKSILSSFGKPVRNKISTGNKNIPTEILKCLFSVNFITLDFGVVGFQSYEMVYDIVCRELVNMNNANNPKHYYHYILQHLLNKISLSLQYPNKINDSKMIFLLSFIENTLIYLSPATLTLTLRDIIEPVVLSETLNSQYHDIREASHSVLMNVLSIPATDSSLQQWQLFHIKGYMNRSIDQYILGLLSIDQLYIISQKLGASIELLTIIKHDFQREWLHNLYLRLINLNDSQNQSKEMIQHRTTLLKCIVYQIPYINARYLLDWLENIQELSLKLLLDDCHYRDIIDTLWDVISNSRSDISIKWWYTCGIQTSRRSHL
ncbi:peroxisomal biogenesis factor 8 [Monosporozyma servazzii]